MIAMKPAGDAPGNWIALDLRADGTMCVRVERPVPRPDGTVEIVLTREQTQLLALLLATAEQPAPI